MQHWESTLQPTLLPPRNGDGAFKGAWSTIKPNYSQSSVSMKDVKHPGTCLQEYGDAQAGSIAVAMVKGLSFVAQLVKNMPAMQETRIWSLGWKDPLEKEMTIHSNILAWRIPWTEAPGGLQFMGLQQVGHNWASNTGFFSMSLVNIHT